MKTLITTIAITLMLATSAQSSPFTYEPTDITEKMYQIAGYSYVQNESLQLAYYGQRNTNGTYRTNRVSGYTKSNGTYVAPYYRS